MNGWIKGIPSKNDIYLAMVNGLGVCIIDVQDGICHAVDAFWEWQLDVTSKMLAYMPLPEWFDEDEEVSYESVLR